MELEKWWAEVQDSSCKDRGRVDVPDYDSIKAALDELEKRYESLKKTHNDNVAAQDKFNGEVMHYIIKKQKRQVGESEKYDLCDFDLCDKWPCGHKPFLEYCRSVRKKVDAPEKQQQEAELRLRCIGCGKESVCSQERSKICDLGGHGPPRCYRFLAPPPTCGNCTKPARWDNDTEVVLCDEESALPLYKATGESPCSHYERRA